ncbi:MAG: aminopeptidase N [Gammaproteobacteria bacterium]
MREPSPRTVHLSDYTAPAYFIDRVELDVDIRADDAIVTAEMIVSRNPAAPPGAPLRLDGEGLELRSIALDGRPLAPGEYTLEPDALGLAQAPERFTLRTVSRIVPQKNTQLEGLYATRSGFVTQCEAQGFRRITWYVDRPDVMARFITTIHGSRSEQPILLSNGNLIAAGEEPGDRHWARFEDPFPKPCYLFALVAARLDVLTDRFQTRSGRSAELAIYVEPGRLDQAQWAMDCLKRAMRWDEQRFGLELDLDQYKIVAVGDFNSGAMENKGLNIFNAKYILARPDTATDLDYLNIDRVVAHEYFHNWTGNRVTCRDWFQLSLKEGLTVFRDQEYGADTWSRAVTRIREVRLLRANQFAEDAGPMAHPVRPQSYMEIRNFYTLTVYEKGAEVVRMQHTLLGEEKFQAGMRLYFRRHDGQAVTCDDFVAAMADASGTDLAQFKRWYDTAGTPQLRCRGQWDAGAGRFTLEVEQSPNPPFHIPLAVGLLGADGSDLLPEGTRVLSVRAPTERFVFDDLPARPVPSLLRGFSAPVVLRYDYTEDELLHLLAHDTDPFNRWDAGQRLACAIILERGGEASAAFLEACGRVLAAAATDPAFAAEVLALPTESSLAEQIDRVDPDALHSARNRLRRAIASTLRDGLQSAYERFDCPGPYSPDATASGRRSLRNLALGYLMELDDGAFHALCARQYERADNMTDALAALGLLANCDCPQRLPALESFYGRWQHEPLVTDKWLAVQAGSRLPGTLVRVRELLAHPAFDIKVPNKVYALVSSFNANHVRFHAADGGGYRFLADMVITLNRINPQVAARMARGFDRWRRFDAGRQAHARAALTSVRDSAGLSNDVAEIVTKALD